MTHIPEQLVTEHPAPPVVDDLYHHRGFASGVDGFEAVGDGEITAFREQGYLVVHNAFAAADVQNALAGLLDLIDGQNPNYNGVQFEPRFADQAHSYPRERRQDIVRKLFYYVEYDARLKAMSEQPQLLEILERMIGDRPVLSQDMALIKPPFVGSEKPWHQDQAYFNIPLGETVVGVWIALDEALPENGCMYIIPGSHTQGPVIHFQRRDWQICDTDVAHDEAIAVPLKPGGCLFFHCLLHHGTPPSRSPRRRRALQFHYKGAQAGSITTEQRMDVFGSEGKDVTC
jgi:phytanoyl-CoA hydroxylase